MPQRRQRKNHKRGYEKELKRKNKLETRIAAIEINGLFTSQDIFLPPQDRPWRR